MGIITPSALHDILDIARYAPSVHNAQPWKVQMSGDVIEVSIDRRHTLSEADPTGRQITLSIGIFSEALRLVAQEKGFTINDLKFQDSRATIRVTKKKKVTVYSDFSKLIKTRCSDRSIYRSAPLDQANIKAIANVECVKDTALIIETNTLLINQVATLTSKAMGLALSNPAFRSELAEYLVLPWSSKQRGVSVSSLYIPQPLAVSEPLLLRFGLGLMREKELELRRWRSASAIVFIVAKGDMPRFWFEAGRTYLRASLAIERLGLSQATSSALVESSNYHEDIEESLGTRHRILAVLRIGSGSAVKHYSSRISAVELLH